jgi:hypothetical protein
LVFAPLFALQKYKARLLQEASALKREKAAQPDTLAFCGLL